MEIIQNKYIKNKLIEQTFDYNLRVKIIRT